MTEKNQDYHEALEDYASQKIDYVFLDISEELDNIERTLETESSKILINWVRDAVMRVAENYKR
jgi:glutaredoxin-related protein